MCEKKWIIDYGIMHNRLSMIFFFQTKNWAKRKEHNIRKYIVKEGETKRKVENREEEHRVKNGVSIKRSQKR